MRRKTRWSWLDLIIAAGIVLFSLYWLVARTQPQGTLKTAVIYKDGVVIERVSLAAGEERRSEERRIDLAPHGVAMVVAVRQGRVRVVSSDCQQQICVRKGWVGRAHDPIICIPNRITIEVTGTDPRYDAISR
ncbi:MAG: NusG domain II-containing protein [Desulfosarcinaceae bacterium]